MSDRLLTDGQRRHPDLFTPEEAVKSSFTRRRSLSFADVRSRTLADAKDFAGSGVGNSLTLNGMSESEMVVQIDQLQAELRDARQRIRHFEMLYLETADQLSRAKAGHEFSNALSQRLGYRAARSRRSVRETNKRLATPATGELPTVLAPLGSHACCLGMALASPPCVYFLCLAGEVVYIGQTKNLITRVADHYGNGEGKSFDSVFYVVVNERELLAVEAAFICYFSPKLNESRPYVPQEYMCQIMKRFGLGRASA